MKLADYQDKLRHLLWLKDISQDYHKSLYFIAMNRESFRVTGINFCCRCDGRTMPINPHRTINPKYLEDALSEALCGVDKEIEALRKELQSVVVEL